MKKLLFSVSILLFSQNLSAQTNQDVFQPLSRHRTFLYVYSGPTGYSGGLGSNLLNFRSLETVNFGVCAGRTITKKAEIYVGFENCAYQYFSNNQRIFSTGVFSGQCQVKLNLLRTPNIQYIRKKLEVGVGFSLLGYYKNTFNDDYRFTGALIGSAGFTKFITRNFGIRLHSNILLPFRSTIDRYESGKRDLLFQHHLGLVIALDRRK